MGQQQSQSKDELLYQQVNYGNVEGIKALRREGAGLEWIDDRGKTPLILACLNPQLYDVAKTLIELGANLNAYRPGDHGGTPLHHAAKRGLENTVKLLLSHGANALVMNDGCQTPLDVARANGFRNVVRSIEAHLCLFSGWLRELHGPGFLELLAPQLLSRKVWVVILPCGVRSHLKPFKLELAIYASDQDAQPRTIVPLWKANLEELNQPDPVAIIFDVSRIPRRWRRRRAIKSSQEARRTRIKLAPLHENEQEQLKRFCNACKGIPQAMHPLVQVPSVSATAPVTTEDEELAMAISASLHSASQQRPLHVDAYVGSAVDASTNSAIGSMNISHHEESSVIGASTSHMAYGNKSGVQEAGPSGSPAQFSQSKDNVSSVVGVDPSPSAVPSAPPATTEDGPIQYPSIDISPVDLPSPAVEVTSHNSSEDTSASSCPICLDAAVEGACVPCGHMAGCMLCLNEIKDKKWGCPVCRAKIDQVIRIYAV